MTRQIHREILAQVLGCGVNDILSQYKNFTAEIQNHVVLALSFEPSAEAKKTVAVFA
jgi:hypothetical protein